MNVGAEGRGGNREGGGGSRGRQEEAHVGAEGEGRMW